MTIYVDELPKSCRECFCNVEDTWCALSDGEMGDICEECDNKTRHKKCPLQPFSDYTKQVRKEVLDIIDKKFNCCGYVEEKFEDIKEYILDQLQGEKK